MPLRPTDRLYLDDDRCLAVEATVVAVAGDALACDRSCFYPGGGGQPADEGTACAAGHPALAVVAVAADGDDVLWHACRPAPAPELVGVRIRLAVDAVRRRAHTRYHSVLHVLNTLALRDYGGWITGVQIGTAYSRIDCKIAGFSPALAAALEDKANAVLAADRALRAYYLPEDEFRRRGDLLRTLEARPPARGGRVRVVEIVGFDAQACGGTHVAGTAEIGRLAIFRVENKGRINKRLYVRLDAPG